MSRMEFNSPDRATKVLDGLYKDMERRINSSLYGLCPVEMSKAFLQMCHAQSCGKCSPCRIGLGQLANLMDEVLNGSTDESILDVLDETAQTIIETADCAIGYEAAEIAKKSLTGFRDDYLSHIRTGKCSFTYGQPVPCVTTCPAHVDIPGDVALVREERYADAIRLIRKDNPFPTTCGYICEHPCEQKCRRNILDDAINIRGIKKMAAELAGEVPAPACGPSTGKKIAIVGGGPGGLSAAYFLQLMGHQTTVYEMHDKLGGMLRYGIPNYRLPKDKLDNDIKVILDTGVEVKYNVKVGRDVDVKSLRDEYDAVLVTIGASTDKKLGIEGEDAKGVISAVEFLEASGCGGGQSLEGKKVCVIGGGNVSMDAVRTAVRKGASDVAIVYRRRIADMTALREEIDSAAEEGIEMMTLKAPSAIIKNEDGTVKGLKVIPQMISEIRNGRASVKPSGEEEYVIPCDMIIVAIGQDIETEAFVENGIPVTKWNTINTKPSGDFDDIPGVFSGGDCASGPATVIKAIDAGKVLAHNVDQYLGFNHKITCDVEVPAAEISDRVPCGRVNLTLRPSFERKADFEGVENSMTHDECIQEASRCLRCDHCGYGKFKGGRVKEW